MWLASAGILITGFALLVVADREQRAATDTSAGEVGVIPELADAPDYRPEVQHDSGLGLCLTQFPVLQEVSLTPSQLRIPALNVNAAVIAVEVNPDGSVQVPEDVNVLGWLTSAASPGDDRGSVVIVGHRDGASGVDGSLYHLSSLSPGQRIEVDTQTGQTVVYEVVAREVLSKDDFSRLAPDITSRDGDPRLTVITCGGEYIKEQGGYQANVVVTAIPVTASQR